MNVYYLLPLLLVALTLIQSPDAFAERGENFDKEIINVFPNGTQQVRQTFLSYERINYNGAWQDYVYTDYGNYLEIKTANNILRLDVITCGFSFHNADNVLLFNDSIIAFSSIVNQYTWSAVTQVNNAACEAYYDVSENSLIAKKYAAGVGYMEYKYIFNKGKWKTQLEATNLTGLTNRVFAFDQTIDLNRDIIKFGGVNRNLDNFSGQSFDRTFLVNNQAKMLDLLNGFNFDFDLGFDYLDSITITDTGANKSKLTFHYMRNNEVLLPGETLIIDPTFGYTTGTVRSIIDTDCNGTANSENTDGYVGANAGPTTCQLSAYYFNVTAIPNNALITTVNFRSDTIEAGSASTVCPVKSIEGNVSTMTIQQVEDDILDGTTYDTVTTQCRTVANNYVISTASMATDLQAELAVDNEWGLGIYGQNYLALQYARIVVPELEVTYDLVPVPDAVDDLTSPSQSYGSVDLLWTEPELHGETCDGYQINYTTPYGNPNTIITNNTGSCTTSATVSSLDIGTDYTFGVSVWTAGGNNATKPPMIWLNVTTAGNFTIGNASFNQTNSQVLPITFEEQDINATAKFLNVTFANTYVMACDFSYQFANDNRTYTGLSSYAVSSTLDETYFILTDFEDEIINVNCYDEITGTDAEYLLVQSDFPLLDQINNFRNGTYGTMGAFGAFDLVTIAVVIFSMIGLNRVNESVGAIFNIILLGSLAYFEIIELPTVIFGVLTVVIIFVITSTRKD